MASVAKSRHFAAAPKSFVERTKRPFIWLVGVLVLTIITFAIAGALLWWQARAAPLPDTSPPPSASGATGPVKGEAYRWRPVAIGGGGFMVGISADRAGETMVARTDVHGAYIWRPEIDRWAQLATEPAMPASYRRPASMDGGVFGIVVAPSDGRRIYMAAKGLVFRSDDRGTSWTSPTSGPFPLRFGAGSDYLRYDPVLAVEPNNPDLVLFGTGFDGLLRSADGGRNWTRAAGLPLPAAVNASSAPIARPTLVWFAPADARAGQVWTLVPGVGMFVSRDGGATFAVLPSGTASAPRALSAGEFAHDGTFFGADADSQTIWRYRDGIWTDLAETGAVARRKYVALAANSRNGEIFAFEHNGRAARSTNGGVSWSALSVSARVGENDPPWLRIANHRFFATSQVHFDPTVPDRLWIAAGTGMFYADVPSGATEVVWVSKTRGIEELVTNDVVQSPGHAPLFAAWDFGIHVRSDLDKFSIGYGPKERVLIAAQQLALTPANRDFVTTNASDTRPCCAEDGDAVLAGYSEDAGRTWRKFPTLPHPPGTSAEDPWRMAFGMIAVSSGNTSNIIWAPSYDRAPFYTRDRGLNWTRVVFPGEKLPFTGSHPAKHLQRKILVADPERPDTFYFAHSGNQTNPQLAGLWRTEDGGASWKMRYRGEIAPKSDRAAKLRAMPGRAGYLFFTSAVEGGHDSRLRRSTDGGANWTIVPNVDRVDDLAFGKAAARSPYPTIYLSGFVSGRYGIWRSVDNAGHWTQIAGLPIGRLDRVVVLGADPDIFGRVYIGWQGSGWLYGEPAACRPALVKSFAKEQCFGVN